VNLKRIPWVLVVFLVIVWIPWLGSRYYTFLATDIVILALFATSLNLLLGSTGLVSFGHAAYFGVGAYACAILTKTHGFPVLAGLFAAPIAAAAVAAFFGFFCVRLTRIYFAMLTLAFAQIVWAICIRWNSVTGGEQGLPSVPYPDMAWMDAVPFLASLRIGEKYYLVVLIIVAISFALLRMIVHSPFGRMLTLIRENPERAQFVGIDVRRYELAAFVLAGAFAGVSGALFGIFNRGVFPDFAYWSKSAEVLIMTLLGGMGHFWGPAVGAAAILWLHQQITAYTQFWPFILGTILIVLLFVFPGGLVGAVHTGWNRLTKRGARA
jgi:branched-chain amino acid transport system permease protein